jgi:hypothetical protein
MSLRLPQVLCYVALLLGTIVPARPAEVSGRSPEDRVLDRFLGTWRTTYTVPKADLQPDAKTGAADMVFTRILGDQFIQEQGVHADRNTALAMYTYDRQRKAYRSWWFSSTGQSGESTGRWDPAAKSFTWTSRTAQQMTRVSRYTFAGDDTFEWNVVVRDNREKVLFQMEGLATRAGTKS